MSRATELARRHAPELRGIAHALPDLFAAAARSLEARLGEEGLREWARIGLALARRSSRSPDVAVSFFEASPRVGLLDVSALSAWAESAAGLADRAPQVAAAFLEATPAALAHLEPDELEVWARQGQRLFRGSWKSSRLATTFFRIAPELLESLSLRSLDRLVDVVDRLAQRSDEMASPSVLDCASLLARLGEPDREPFLCFTQALCDAAPVDTHRCLERGPVLLSGVHPDQRRGLLDLAVAAASEECSGAFSLFAAAARALGAIDPEAQAEVVELARRLARYDASVALESVASVAELRRRLSSGQARRWLEAGVELLREGRSAEGAGIYFRIESARAEQMLGEVASRIELSQVGTRLRLYAKALSGEAILVQPTKALAERNIGWAATAAPTTDGLSIFLPSEVDLFGDRDANFQVYKVHTTHQAGRLEFGSFRYRFGLDGGHLPSSALDRERLWLEAGQGAAGERPGRPAELERYSSSARTPMQRLLDLFEDRRLISELFALAEGSRIDACISVAYPGIRLWIRRLQELEARQRPDVRRMALRQAFVENLLRASLGHADAIRWPQGLAARLERAVATLRVVERSGATVQDSAEVAAGLYDLAIAVPNLPAERVPVDWGELDERSVARAAALGGSGLPGDEELPEGEEVPYESPGQPAYRGSFKPELVQLLAALCEPEKTEDDRPPFTREQILELLASSAELELAEGSDDQDGDLDVLRANIEREAADRRNEADEADGPGSSDDPDGGIEWFRYDEWDFLANDYRRSWCRVGERTAAEGELAFYDETLRRHHGLVIETRRQFERLRPESFRRLKRLEDGHEIELDRAVEFHADKKAGAGPLARFYSRRHKQKRDVAVAFLLDMSGSTGEEIVPAAGLPGGGAAPGARRLPTARGQQRIIDLEREATVLVVEALEALGDAYGLYGFSGQGRENVEFHVIKDIEEPFGDSVRRRIDKIEPIRATRMGAAIRHTVAKLNAHDAKVKILILVSDGRPEDEEYGRDRREKEYAVHDTRRALIEAKRRRIAPFLITVDSAGHDYLRHMCDDLGYEVVADIESLPRRLPKLYRTLAAE